MDFSLDIDRCILSLKKNGTILYPTDTIWGIGCDALSDKAVRKVYKIKHRPDSKSMIVLVDSLEMLQKYVSKIPDVALDLMNQITSPLTIIYNNPINLPSSVLAVDGSVGIRLTRSEFCKELIWEFGKPIVSTSANISGSETPLIFNNIDRKIIDAVDCVVEYGQNDITSIRPSTIIKVTGDYSYDVLRA